MEVVVYILILHCHLGTKRCEARGRHACEIVDKLYDYVVLVD